MYCWRMNNADIVRAAPARAFLRCRTRRRYKAILPAVMCADQFLPDPVCKTMSLQPNFDPARTHAPRRPVTTVEFHRDPRPAGARSVSGRPSPVKRGSRPDVPEGVGQTTTGPPPVQARIGNTQGSRRTNTCVTLIACPGSARWYWAAPNNQSMDPFY